MKQLNFPVLLVSLSICLASATLAQDVTRCEIDSFIWSDAKRGLANSQYFLAVKLYKCGEIRKARQWYREAVKGGHPFAMNNLANMYRLGCGVERDNAKALTLFRQALFNKGRYGRSEAAKDHLVGYKETYIHFMRVHDDPVTESDLEYLHYFLFNPKVTKAQLKNFGRIFDHIATRWDKAEEWATGTKPRPPC